MTLEKILQEYAKLHLQLIQVTENLAAAQAQIAQMQAAQQQEQLKAKPAQQ